MITIKSRFYYDHLSFSPGCIHRLIDWFTAWFIYWLIDPLIDWFIVWSIAWLIGWHGFCTFRSPQVWDERWEREKRNFRWPEWRGGAVGRVLQPAGADEFLLAAGATPEWEAQAGRPNFHQLREISNVSAGAVTARVFRIAFEGPPARPKRRRSLQVLGGEWERPQRSELTVERER